MSLKTYDEEELAYLDALIETFEWAKEHPGEVREIQKGSRRKASEIAKKYNDFLKELQSRYYPDSDFKLEVDVKKIEDEKVEGDRVDSFHPYGFPGQEVIATYHSEPSKDCHCIECGHHSLIYDCERKTDLLTCECQCLPIEQCDNAYGTFNLDMVVPKCHYYEKEGKQ